MAALAWALGARWPQLVMHKAVHMWTVWQSIGESVPYGPGCGTECLDKLCAQFRLQAARPPFRTA
jgi:hypothetical protein